MATVKNKQTAGHGVFPVSLGCPKNLVDTEVIAGTMLTAGWNLEFDPEQSELYLINTCAFLPSARQEAYAAIEEAIRWKKRRPGRKIAVAGCLSRWQKKNGCEREFPEVDLWSGPDDPPRIAELMAAGKKEGSQANSPCWLYDENTPRLQLTLPHLAYLKIADGCCNCCTYCSIPNIRGKMRSRPIASVVKEAENLIAGGVKELIVIAQDVTAYGLDRPESGETLTGLLEALNALPGDFVIRLLYTHPAHYTEEFIDFLARRDTRLLPYLDMPLQHISDRILADMHRHVTKAEIVSLLKKLRERVPDLTLRTTFIVGFPGETEAEFDELMKFVEEFKFERCGAFAYAAEPGTAAGARPDQVPAKTARARERKLMRRQQKIMEQSNRRWIGREIPVIIDGIEDGVACARGAMDAPEIDNAVLFKPTGRMKAGEVCTVRILEADDNTFEAEVVRRKKR